MDVNKFFMYIVKEGSNSTNAIILDINIHFLVFRKALSVRKRGE